MAKKSETGGLKTYWPDRLAVPKFPGSMSNHVALILSALIIASPVLLAMIMSTQTRTEIYDPTYLLPGGAGLGNYYSVIVDHGFATFLMNSFIMTTIVVIAKVGLSLLAVLVIVYYRFPFKNLVFLFILFTLMFPVPIRLVPLYDLMSTLGWTNTMLAITVPYFASATAVFILRQHFMSIPESLVENAQLDGVGPITFLYRVLIPMSKGMIAGVSVITFIATWHQYLWPLVVIRDESSQVAVVGIKLLEATQWSGQAEWGLVMSASVLTLIPPLVVLLVFHKPVLNAFGLQQQ